MPVLRQYGTSASGAWGRAGTGVGARVRFETTVVEYVARGGQQGVHFLREFVLREIATPHA
eukprot:8456210-Lingulodinium_polyedra.AAC.1